MKRTYTGFTLVELLAAIAIVGVLVTLALPRYRAHVARARMAEAKVNLGTLSSHQKAYRFDGMDDADTPYRDKATGYHRGLYYGLDKCGDSLAESKNELGFRLSDCTKSRYRYITNLGDDCAKSDGSIAQGQVYPNCIANDEWHVTLGGKLTHADSVVKKCPDATSSSSSSSCSAVLVSSLSPTPTAPTLPTAPTAPKKASCTYKEKSKTSCCKCQTPGNWAKIQKVMGGLAHLCTTDKIKQYVSRGHYVMRRKGFLWRRICEPAPQISSCLDHNYLPFCCMEEEVRYVGRVKASCYNLDAYIDAKAKCDKQGGGRVMVKTSRSRRARLLKCKTIRDLFN
ncbi:MAG: type II secretion system protein [Pseudomonadota bacterium]|nr:type II secretion system protein [Pseudomonadota bacterium]